MAERRIAEKTGRGVVCFISNYSWLDGGDKYKTGKVSPDGLPDPSIFSTESDPVGIQVGTAIVTLVRKADQPHRGEASRAVPRSARGDDQQ